MEDAQPNEHRLSRKGTTTIPRVRTVHTPYLYPYGSDQAPKRSTKHHTRARNAGPRLVGARPNAERIRTKARSSVKVRDPTQSNEPGPSCLSHAVRPVVGGGGCSQRIDCQSSNPFSGHLANLFTTEVKLRCAQTIPANPAPCHPLAIHAAASPESIIDSTLGPSTGDIFRWSTFRSGQLDICVPLPSVTDIGLQPSVQRNASVVPGGDPVRHLAQPVVDTNVTVPVYLVEDIGTSSTPDQLDAPESAHPSHSEVVLEDHTRLFPDYGSSALGFPLMYGKLSLSLGPHDRPRRVLRGEGSAYIVTAHGVIDQIGVTGVVQLDRHIRIPHSPMEESVDDACILTHQGDSFVIFGHAREQHQITVLDVKHCQAPRHAGLSRNWNTAKKPGVSAVAALTAPLKFASGGYDHRVHLWDLAHDLSGASSTELAIKHSSLVHSLLAIMDTSHKLVSVGADRDVPIYDISAERVVQTLKMSSVPYHAHKTESPSCTLLEVAHLETQFEVRDHRFSQQTVQRFGFITEERRGRFEKADTWSHFVVCGDKNGVVRLWDLRNVSKEVAIQPCFGDPVVQVVNVGAHLLACSKRNELVCIDFPVGQ